MEDKVHPAKAGSISLHNELALVSKDDEGHLDAAAEKRLVRKCDWNLIPVLFVLYILSFVDRINIGNARIQGLEADLNMTGDDYNVALFIFFIPYILCEVPANMLLKRVRPSLFLSAIMVAWAIVTIGQGVTGSFTGLVICRVLIGVLEAGFFPGCCYLISMYYKRHELQWRITLFFCAGILAGAFSGLLAYAIAHMDGMAGYGGWRWIFIIEGLATFVVAIGACWFIPDWPRTAKFLKPEERELLFRRLAHDNEDAYMDHWNKKAARRVFGDLKIYISIVMYMGIVVTSYSFLFFTPTILKQLGWTSVRAQVMSIPLFVVAAALSLCVALLSDKLHHRFSFVILGCLISTIGYGILLATHQVAPGVRYFALYLVISGGFIAQPITIVWLNKNLGGHYKRGIGAAMQVGLGNISGIIASNIYLPNQAPTYTLGFSLGLGFVWLTVIASVVFLFHLKRENKIRDQGGRDDRYHLPEDEKRNLGDDYPTFRFTF